LKTTSGLITVNSGKVNHMMNTISGSTDHGVMSVLNTKS